MTQPSSGSPPPESYRIVEDPEQARLLSDPTAFPYFEPFLARERSASQAAIELGVRLDTLLYRIRRFQEAGLLVVSRQEKRAGRPIKLYRSDADAYFIPFAATPFADLRERHRSQVLALAERAAELMARWEQGLGPLGRRIYRAPDGEVWTDTADAPQRSFEPGDRRLPPTELLSGDLRLRPEQARELLNELWGLWRRYYASQTPGAPSYLVWLGLVQERE